jgi:uncharacterized protein YggE
MKKKNRSKGKLLLIASLSMVAALSIFIFTGCLDTQIPEITIQEETGEVQVSQNTISVIGTGRIKVLPDEVFINISILTERPTTQEAVDENSIITNNLISVIEKIEAENLTVETIGYELRPLYDYTADDEPPTIYAYRVNTTIEVKTTDVDKIGEIITKATESGATTISSIGFDLSDETKSLTKKEALAEATRDASEKALAIAQSLGLKIERVVYISETEVLFPGPLMAPQGLGEVRAEEVTAPVILPQEIEVTATLNIIYLFNE